MTAAADKYELFDTLTQNLVYSGADGNDDLHEIDELFSQVPLPSDIYLGLAQYTSLNSSVREISKELEAQAETQRPSRFGPLVSESDIISLAKGINRKNSNGRMEGVCRVP